MALSRVVSEIYSLSKNVVTMKSGVRSPSLCLLAGPPRFFQLVSRCIYTLNSSLATPVYLYVCVRHVNNELRDTNVNMLYSI